MWWTAAGHTVELTGRGSEPHTHLNVRPVMRRSIDPLREVRLSLPVRAQGGQRSGSRAEMHSGSSLVGRKMSICHRDASIIQALRRRVVTLRQEVDQSIDWKIWFGNSCWTNFYKSATLFFCSTTIRRQTSYFYWLTFFLCKWRVLAILPVW